MLEEMTMLQKEHGKNVTSSTGWDLDFGFSWATVIPVLLVIVSFLVDATLENLQETCFH